MEGAQADEVAAGAAQANVRADYLDDIGALPHLIDRVVTVSRHHRPHARKHIPQPRWIVGHYTIDARGDQNSHRLGTHRLSTPAP